MKLNIELNDNDLRRAIDESVGAHVSQLANEIISRRVTDVLDKKLQRMGIEDVDQALAAAAAATKILKDYLDRDGSTSRAHRFNEALSKAAREALKELRS